METLVSKWDLTFKRFGGKVTVLRSLICFIVHSLWITVQCKSNESVAVIESDRIVLVGTHRMVVPGGDLRSRVSLSTLHIQELKND